MLWAESGFTSFETCEETRERKGNRGTNKERDRERVIEQKSTYVVSVEVLALMYGV